MSSNGTSISAEMERVSNGEIPVPSYEFLIEALNHPDTRTRNLAGLALGPFGDKRAIKPLLHTREHDSNSWVRHRAAIALAYLDYSNALHMLMTDLRSEDHLMSSSAASALFDCCGGRGKAAIYEALLDENANARASAVMTLAESGGKSTFDIMIKALDDKDNYVRTVATRNLGRLGDKRAVEPLIAALIDGSNSVRGGAAYALGGLDDTRAVEPVIQVLLNDKVAKTRMEAALALGNLGDERALPALLWAQQNDKGEWRPGDSVQDCATHAIEKLKKQN